MEKQLIFPMEEKYRDYLTDESKLQGWAESISFPTSEEEIVEIIKNVQKAQKTITIQGGKSGIAGGAVPQGGHIMNLSRMNRCRGQYERDGVFYLIVEPGLTLAELQKEIDSRFRGKNLLWAPSPTESTATIGGVAATGAQGLCALYYGNTGDYIQGVRLIGIDGRIYELNREKKEAELVNVLGMEGLVGIFSELTLRLTEKPEEMWGIVFFFEEEKKACGFADAVQQKWSAGNMQVLAAAEYLDRQTIDLIESRKDSMTKLKEVPDVKEKVQAMVYLELFGKESEIEVAAEEFMELAMKYDSDPNQAWALTGELQMGRMRAFRHAAAEAANCLVEEKRKMLSKLTKLGTDMSLPSFQFSEIQKQSRKDMEREAVRGCIFGHIISNHLHINLFPETEEEYKRCIALLQKWSMLTQEKGGHVHGEHGIGKLKKKLFPKILTKEEQATYRELKRKYDSKYFWNPGNVL